MNKAQMIKGLDALADLIKAQDKLRRDGLIFIFEKGLWQEFMEYHVGQSIKKEA